MSSEDTEHKDLFKRNLSHGSLAALGQRDEEAEFTVRLPGGGAFTHGAEWAQYVVMMMVQGLCHVHRSEQLQGCHAWHSSPASAPEKTNTGPLLHPTSSQLYSVIHSFMLHLWLVCSKQRLPTYRQRPPANSQCPPTLSNQQDEFNYDDTSGHAVLGRPPNSPVPPKRILKDTISFKRVALDAPDGMPLVCVGFFGEG
jgi:hypothetical protein